MAGALPPLVSVIVRSMDPPTLVRALDSVAAQDYPAIEVVLVAACGPSHRPVDASRYPFRLTFVQSDVPLPRPGAANAGLDASHGSLITFLDHDDEFLPGHLSGLASALASRPDCGVAYCKFQVFEAGKNFVTIGGPFNRLALHEKSYIHHSALLFRHDLLATGVRYDTALDIHDDWDFVLQLSEHTRFLFVDQTTFRWHSDIGTSGGGGVGNFDPAKYTTQRNYVREKWASVYQRHVERYNATVDRGMAAARIGALDEAEQSLAQALADVEDDPDLLNAMAMIAFRREHFDLARSLAERAVRGRDSDARLWLNVGLACAAAGAKADARAAFERVLALAPGHDGARAQLAKLDAPTPARRTASSVSVVICSIDAAKFAQASASYERALAGVDHEIIGIHDARSLAEGYNRGIERARGDTLVFSHDDVELLSPDFGERVRAHLERFDVVGIAGTTRLVGGAWHFAGFPYGHMLYVAPHPETGKLVLIVGGGGDLVVQGAQALDGVFLGVRAEIARALRFDAATFDDFHLYDLDFTFRAHLAGHRLAVCRDLVLVHYSQGNYGPRWDEHRQRFERKFKGKLAAPSPSYRKMPVTNVPLDDAVLRDPIAVKRLCAPATLARFAASVDRMIAA